MTFEQLQHQRNFEQNALIWLDENLNDIEDVNQIKLKLCRVINYTRIFENADECVDYMSSNENEHIYFLISGSLADIIAPLVYEMKQIKRIYIFCISRQYYGKLAETLAKIGGIFTDLTVLSDALQRDILANKTTASSVYNSSTLLLSGLPSSDSDRSNQQEATFIYFRLLAELLVGLEHKQSTKNEFISVCRSQYFDNTPELEKIEEFSRTYSKEHAIRWYTRDSFLYRILNNALRTQDIDILFKLGFFIADLHNQIEHLHSEQSKLSMLPSVVYRGQFMTTNELDNKIKKNIGGFLSVNSFFSTSANKQVALMFAGNSSSTDSGIASVLFEITIDSEKCRRPIADIKRMSYMEEEDEILFSMAAVFRIESVHQLYSEDIWMVRLIMNGEEDEELNTLAGSIKSELGQSDSLSVLSGLLMTMGDLQKAEYFMLMVIRETQPDDLFVKTRCYSNLSMIYNELMDYDAALSWAEKALQLRPSDFELLRSVYTNLGLSYVKKDNTVQALHYLHKAADVCKGRFPPTHLKLAPIYLTLGTSYTKQKDFSRALEYFLKVLDIYQTSLPANHPNTGLVCCHIGSIYLIQDDYDSALFYLLKGLKIQQRSLPAKHPHLAFAYAGIGLIYLRQSNDIEAYNSYQKALEIIESSPNHPHLPTFMYYMGLIHYRKNNLTEALKFYHKALNAQMQSMSTNHVVTIECYKALGGLYLQQKDYIKGIDYYKKAISLTNDHYDLVFYYNMIAYSYNLLRDYETASRYVELALDVGRKRLPPGHRFIQKAEEHQKMLEPMLAARTKSHQPRNRNQTN